MEEFKIRTIDSSFLQNNEDSTKNNLYGNLSEEERQEKLHGKLLAKAIKDGSYFKEAIEWYSVKYIYPITERSYIFLFAFITFLALAVVGINSRSIGNLTEVIPFVTYVDDSAHKFSNIKKISQNNQSPQEAVTEYLVKDYVMTREMFDPTKMDNANYLKLTKKIKSSSSKEVLNQYKNYMNILNPYSPFIRYKKGVIREITINNFKLLKGDAATGKAMVIFTAEEIEAGKINSTTQWQAMVYYTVPDVETISRTKSPLRFLVKYYYTKPLNKDKS